MYIPDNVFIVRSMKFGTDVLLDGFLGLSTVSVEIKDKEMRILMNLHAFCPDSFALHDYQQ